MLSASRLAFAAAALALGASSAPAQQPPLPTRQPTLADRLNLRPDQQPALRAYQDELALERADAAHAASEVGQLNAMKTPDRLDWSQSELPKREAAARRAARATLAFYQSLSADQQAVFDRLTRIPPPGGAGPRTADAPRSLRSPPAGGELPTPAAPAPRP